jgi:hypothetical protein
MLMLHGALGIGSLRRFFIVFSLAFEKVYTVPGKTCSVQALVMQTSLLHKLQYVLLGIMRVKQPTLGGSLLFPGLSSI